MSGPHTTGPGLWCPEHGEYEHPAVACEDAFDPDDVAWLEPAPGGDDDG